MSARDDVLKKVTELLPEFGDNAFLLFSMGLSLATEDYDHLYSEALLDGSDDKKIDFFYIDWATGRAIVAQGYHASKWDAVDPPSNKASDLNTAVSWLFDSQLGTIPRPQIQAAAEQLRDGLEAGDIHTIEFYFVHNSKDSTNVDNELATVEASLINRLKRHDEEGTAVVSAVARQLSLRAVISLYESRYSAIRVSDEIDIGTVGQSQLIVGPGWEARYATVRGRDLVNLVEKYGEALYSANIRDYLGKRAYTRNINRKIAQTAITTPRNFWVYNNGVTFITRRVTSTPVSLQCSGLAVINGAQTLGSLHEASNKVSIQFLDDVQILIRVVESADTDLIQEIIRNNNTQNPIKPRELRVLDPLQERIERDFADKLSIKYQFRRGIGRRASQDVLFEKLALWLNSFAGEPITSHRNSPDLFDNEKVYRSLFNETSNVRHFLFVYRLGEAVAATKDEYRTASELGTASETDDTLYGYFRYGAFTHVAMHLCAEMFAELFGGGPTVKRRFTLHDRLLRDREAAIDVLKKAVKFTLAPLPSELKDKDAYRQFRSRAGISGLASRVKVSVNQMQAISPNTLDILKDGIELL